MELFMYPSPYMRITQGYGINNHKSSFAIDDGGSDSGKDYIIAPYSGTVKRIYPQFENEVFFVSDEEVLFADGTVDYATTMFVHQDSPMAFGMALNKHYEQGEKIYIEGGRYAGRNGVFATHLHVEFARGTTADWYKNASGIYSLKNAKKPEECCFVDDSYHILYSPYKFKNVKDAYTPGNYQTLYNMKVREGSGTNFACKKVGQLSEDGKKNATNTDSNADAVYKKGTVFTARRLINNSDGSIWAESPSGYICIKDNKQTYCNKK